MIKTQIYLRRGKEESLLRRHPWIFSGAIERIKSSEEEIKEGEIILSISNNYVKNKVDKFTCTIE